MKKHTSSFRKNPRTKDGFIMLTVVVIFLMISLGAALSLASIVYRESAVVRNSVRSTQSMYASESLQEDIFYRFVSSKDVPPTVTLTLNGATAEAVVEDLSGTKRITSVGDAENRIRKTEMILETGAGAAFFYGVQAGQGGFVMTNFTQIIGNVYSSGPIIGTNSASITGDVVSAEASGLIDGLDISGSAFAQRIEDSDIGGDAYYQSIFKTDVAGTEYPGSANQSELPLPISDEMVEEWKSVALAGGTATCPYSIGSDVTIGPLYIPCDLSIYDGTVTLTGPVWVDGDVSISGTSVIRVSSTLGSRSVPIIADDESDRASRGRFTLSNSSEYFGSGDDRSYVILLSQNNSAENGGSTKAITMSNSSAGKLVLYAGHGEIELSNNVDLSEVTAYRIRLSNSAIVRYETGLASLTFTSGPSGGYILESLKEVQ
ncbi:MAG: hypothetical protein WDZ74_00395 [Candidatus Paceibacterota bacterium]